jgi:protein-S-isoprenylcysteine O-methyltransferase Ste14
MSESSPGSTERSKVGMLVPPPFLLLGLAAASTAAQFAWFGPFTGSPLLLGCAVLGGSLPFAAAAIVFVAVVHVGVVLPEERYMESLHGEAYRAFKARVRRWL